MALSLLSGGIDSPVASWMVAKRGMEIEDVKECTSLSEEQIQQIVKELR